MQTLRTLLLALALLAICGGVAAARADTAIDVIVNANNPLRTLNAADVRHLFMHDIASFPDGSTAHPYDNQPEEEVFYRQIAARSALQMRAYWARVVFTSSGSPPPQLHDDAAAIAKAAQDRAAITYVSDKTPLPHNVKLVLVIP